MLGNQAGCALRRRGFERGWHERRWDWRGVNVKLRGWLLGRVGGALATILMVLLLNFVLFRLMPGSPDRALARNPRVSAEAIAAARVRWGLDKPLFPDQLVAYVGATLSGDFGYSVKYGGREVTSVIGEKIAPTLLIVGLGEIIALAAGIALGAWTGWRRGKFGDRVGTLSALILYSMPYFWLGMLLVTLFATTLGWLPTSGISTPGGPGGVAGIVDLLRHAALPIATIALGLIGQYAILLRSSVAEALREGYVLTARAKGLRDDRILRGHILPNALLPTVTLAALNAGYVIGGALTVEIVFSWPGLGLLTQEALQSRDYPVLQGIFLLLSISVVVANLLADLLYSRLDPRVRHGAAR